MHQNYRSPILRQLRDQQVRYAPRERKVLQAARAEKLLTEIDSHRVYPYEYLCYHLTDFRPDSQPGVSVGGSDAQHDLRLLVEDLTDAANLDAEGAGERVWTVEDLSRHFNVSTKTIARWRQQGLVSRRFMFDNRKRVGFLQSSVERFVNDNSDRIERGSQFSQISEEERTRIVSYARRLAQAGGCPAEVTRRVANRTGRSPETIRYTLKQFDEQHPEMALFPGKSGPLSEEAKREICLQFRQGVKVDDLAVRHCRTKTSIYRIINEMRGRRIMEMPLDHIENPLFDEPNAADLILGPPPVADNTRKTRPPAGLPAYLADLYEIPLLTPEQEVYLFRKMNFLRHRASKLRDQLDLTHTKSSLMDQIEQDYEEALATKNQIIRANLRLVVSIAKRHVAATENIFELISDGNVSLIRAVEKFDYGRGNKFSTYATWALMKNFARSIPDEHKRRTRFRNTEDEMFDATMDRRTDQYELEMAQTVRESEIGRILNRLDEREQQIIISRFGLNHDQEPLTLKEVGTQMGVTKERVRQIESRALAKLRKAALEEKIDAPEA